MSTWIILILCLLAVLALACLVMLLLLLGRMNDTRRENNRLQELLTQQNSQQRQELTQAMGSYNDTVNRSISQTAELLQKQLESFSSTLLGTAESNRRQNEELRSSLEAGLRASREDSAKKLEEYRESVARNISRMAELLQQQMSSFSDLLRAMSQDSQQQNEKMRQTVEASIHSLQEENSKKLEQMRATVDEKLNATLEERLTKSFSAVSDRLEQVYKGLGEMQSLASGVGDLKKVLTNVKTRGTWGEISLGSLLEQILSPSQYQRNVRVTPRSSELVEFAICLPSKEEDGKVVYLPLDCKFPTEDYLRLVEASEAGDNAAAEAASKQLEAAVKRCASDIHNKYIRPPYTTDFGIMYLPVEGLYAEIARKTGLCEQLQRDYRVTVAGPTTIGAFLNSLQMGFRTLAIQKRSSEISRVLTAVKTDFTKFADLLDSAKKKLESAGNTLDQVSSRYRIIDKRLNKVDSLDEPEEQPKLPTADS